MLKAKIGVVAAVLVTALGTKEAVMANAAQVSCPLPTNQCGTNTYSALQNDCLSKLSAWNVNVNCDQLKEILGNGTYPLQNIISGWNGCLPQLPNCNKPGTETPDTNKPGTETPDTNKPGTETPDTNKPGTETPDTNKPGTGSEAQSEAEKVGRRIVELVNEQRAAAGLSKVEYSASLSKATQTRAVEIKTSFSHTRPDGRYFSSVLSDNGISYRICGENIAWGQKSAEDVMNAWMNSPGHMANILKPGFTKLGVGYTENNGVKYFTQLFTN